jgi:hypothetical protein
MPGAPGLDPAFAGMLASQWLARLRWRFLSW